MHFMKAKKTGFLFIAAAESRIKFKQRAFVAIWAFFVVAFVLTVIVWTDKLVC